ARVGRVRRVRPSGDAGAFGDGSAALAGRVGLDVAGDLLADLPLKSGQHGGQGRADPRLMRGPVHLEVVAGAVVDVPLLVGVGGQGEQAVRHVRAGHGRLVAADVAHPLHAVRCLVDRTVVAGAQDARAEV